MTTDNPAASIDINGELGEAENPIEKYETLKAIATQLSTLVSEAVIAPVAKKHFEEDRGQKVTQVLPDRSDEYQFESHGFTALILPDERRVTNQSYNGNTISTNGIVRYPEQFSDILSDAADLWRDTFGEWRRHVNQPVHPGPFPLQDTDAEAAVEYITSLYEDLVGSNSIELAVEAARKENYPLLSGIFNVEEHEMLTPGGDDLSALVRMNSYSTPYNDGSLALVAPAESNSGRQQAQRGVIVGHDDTPTGIFCHVVDVTNLDRRRTISHDMIRSAMGFDREIDPWSNIDELAVETGERVRLQGDLRVERVGEIDGFADELARNTRQQQYTELVESELESATIAGRYVRGQRGDLDVLDAFDVTASDDGRVALDPNVSDPEVELLAYANILCVVETGPARQYDDYDDIPYVNDPWRVRQSIAVNDTPTAITKARADVQETIEAIVSPHRTEIESTAREIGAEAKAEMDVPTQENLPVDNHLAMIESGFAPDVDTEPVPVGIPERTTLHIEHGEHNSVTLKINPGVYRFSLLPRGLQPADERPQWE